MTVIPICFKGGGTSTNAIPLPFSVDPELHTTSQIERRAERKEDYDNNPYADDPDARPRQNLRIVRRLRDIGIAVLAHGHDSEIYTTTMLLDCSRDRVREVQDIICEEVEETLRELYAD